MFQHTNSKGPRLKIQPRRIPHLCRYPSIILMTLSTICTYYWGTVQSRNTATIVQNSNAYLIVIVRYLLQNIYVKWCLGIILYCSQVHYSLFTSLKFSLNIYRSSLYFYFDCTMHRCSNFKNDFSGSALQEWIFK